MPDDWMHVRSTGLAALVIYRRGARIAYVPRAENTPPNKTRGAIGDMSDDARHRAAFYLGNAECEWAYFSTLTYRGIPSAKKARRDHDCMRRRFKARWGEPVDAWAKEIQRRGAIHFHFFHARESAFGQACELARREIVRRIDTRGPEPIESDRIILRGGVDHWLSDAWIATVGDDHPSFLAVQRGGIIEPMKSPDAAGRYMAAELGKRHQKELPEDLAETGIGRWWWMNPRWKPRPRFVGTVQVESLPFDHPCPFVWDSAVTLGACATIDVHRVGYDSQCPTVPSSEMPTADGKVPSLSPQKATAPRQ